MCVNKSKELILYFSYSGNSRRRAAQLAALLDAPCRELKPKQPYPRNDRALVALLQKEYEERACPDLEGELPSAAEFDRLYLVSPNWVGSFAAPLRSYLRTQEMRGKEIVPVATHGGSGLAKMPEDYASECPEATVLPGLALREEESEADVRAKLAAAGYLKTVGTKQERPNT